MQYVPDNYDMFRKYEYDQEQRIKQEQKEWEEIYGSEETEFMEDRDRISY